MVVCGYEHSIFDLWGGVRVFVRGMDGLEESVMPRIITHTTLDTIIERIIGWYIFLDQDDCEMEEDTVLANELANLLGYKSVDDMGLPDDRGRKPLTEEQKSIRVAFLETARKVYQTQEEDDARG